MSTPSPPPPPPRKERAPTTAAALTLAGIAVVGWLAASFVLGAFGMVDLNGQSSAPYEEDHWTATMVALALLGVAAALYAVPRLLAGRRPTRPPEV